MPQPSLQDLNAPFDPTGFGNITGAQLLTFLIGATPYTNNGFIVNTTDSLGVPNVPDANTNAKWKRYMWVRTTTDNAGNPTGIAFYLWNAAAANDATYQRWQVPNIAVAVGFITNAMLAGGITFDKILSVNWGSLLNIPASFPPGGAAGGDLTGTYPNPVLNPPNGRFSPASLIVPNPADPGTVLRVDRASNLPIFSESGLIQRTVLHIAGQKDSTATCTDGNPAVGEGTQLGLIAFTPVSSNSIIRLSLSGVGWMDDTTATHGFFSFFQGGATLMTFQQMANSITAPANSEFFGRFEYMEAYIQSWGSNVARNLQARMGVVSNAGGQGIHLGLANTVSYLVAEEFFGTYL